MATDLVVRMRNVIGKPAPVSIMYTVNRRNFPFFSEWRQVAPGDWAIRYPKEEPFGLAALWEIPGFGKVIVTADNEGKWYRADQGGLVDWRAEAAKSKVKRVQDRMQSLAQSGYQFAPALAAQMAQAAAELQAALKMEGEAAARRLVGVPGGAPRQALWLDILPPRRPRDVPRAFCRIIQLCHDTLLPAAFGAGAGPARLGYSRPFARLAR